MHDGKQDRGKPNAKHGLERTAKQNLFTNAGPKCQEPAIAKSQNPGTVIWLNSSTKAYLFWVDGLPEQSRLKALQNN